MTDQSKPNSKKVQKKHSTDRRKQIALIIFMAAGLLVSLAILSYSGHDEAVTSSLSFVDVFRFPFNHHVKVQAHQIQNPFGLLGALPSHSFVLRTIRFCF